jgi:hypothetical protein
LVGTTGGGQARAWSAITVGEAGAAEVGTDWVRQQRHVGGHAVLGGPCLNTHCRGEDAARRGGGQPALAAWQAWLRREESKAASNGVWTNGTQRVRPGRVVGCGMASAERRWIGGKGPLTRGTRVVVSGRVTG